jgi:hypothetical protein
MKNNFNKKGLSTVVTTLIIILLVIVAIGIVWVVVRNVIEQGTGQIDIGVKCINNVVKATSVDCTNPASCTVTLKRDTGDDEIGGVKLVFSEGATGGNVEDISASTYPNLNIALNTITATGLNSGFTTPDKVEVTVYFLDDSESEKLCSLTSQFSF